MTRNHPSLLTILLIFPVLCFATGCTRSLRLYLLHYEPVFSYNYKTEAQIQGCPAVVCTTPTNYYNDAGAAVSVESGTEVLTAFRVGRLDGTLFLADSSGRYVLQLPALFGHRNPVSFLSADDLSRYYESIKATTGICTFHAGTCTNSLNLASDFGKLYFDNLFLGRSADFERIVSYGSGAFYFSFPKATYALDPASLTVRECKNASSFSKLRLAVIPPPPPCGDKLKVGFITATQKRLRQLHHHRRPYRPAW